MFNVRFVSVITLVCLALLSGCATVRSYDYSALTRSKPRSILVVPPANRSVEVNAPYVYLSTISRPLAEKGYYVFPVAVIDHFLKENGLPTPAEMNTIPLDKVRKYIGADAVLYVTIENWGQKYHVLSSKAVVSASLKLVDVQTGELLWDARAYAEQSGGNNGLLGAIVDQVVGSMIDATPNLSRMANTSAINHSSHGLLPGPYRVTEP